MKVVVVGAGRMAAIRSEDLASDARVEQVLIANRSPGRAHDLARAVGATPVDWSEVLTVDADAYVVALATDAHAGLLADLAERAAPILCEKPIALTLTHTEEVIRHARHHSAPLQVGFQRRFDPGIRRARDLVAGGGLGVVYSMAMTSHDHTPSTREFLAGSGGIFRDLHVHDFDLVRWMTGSEVETVYATRAVRAHEQYAEFDDADVAQVHLVTSSGVQVAVSGARHDALGHDVRMDIFGSADSVAVGLNPRTPLHALDGDVDPTATLDINRDPYLGFVDRFRTAFRDETAAFVGFVRGESGNPCPPESALESLRIAIACEASVARGEAVRVAEMTSAGR